MHEERLYLFYGGIFYRTSSTSTLSETDYPIGFLLRPQILDDSDVHYPFDTGAMFHGIYEHTPGDFEFCRTNFRVESGVMETATRAIDGVALIVKHVFGTNRNYLAGRPVTLAIQKPDPIPELARFLLSEVDRSDHRRACVETQKRTPVSLPENLIWIGFPDIWADEFHDYLMRNEPHEVVEPWAYPSYARYVPSGICAQMQGRALAVLEKYFPD